MLTKALTSSGAQGPSPLDETPPSPTLKPRHRDLTSPDLGSVETWLGGARASVPNRRTASRSRTLERHYGYSTHDHWPNTRATTISACSAGFMLTPRAH